MINAVTFDVDDTLVFTSKNAFLKTNLAGQDLGYPRIDWDTFLSSYGIKTYEECISGYFPGIDIELFNIRYQEVTTALPDIPIPGSFETIEKLLGNGIFVGILSNGPREKVARKLKSIGFGDNPSKYFFEIIDGTTLGRNKKPSKKAFDPILRRFSTNDVLHVGDSVEDIISSIGAKVDVLGVLTGYTKREALIQAGLGEEKIISDVQGVIGFLDI